MIHHLEHFEILLKCVKLLNNYFFSKIFQEVKIVILQYLQRCCNNFSIAMKDWKYISHISAIFCAM